MGKQEEFFKEIEKRMPKAFKGAHEQYKNAVFQVSEFLKNSAVGKLNLLEEAMQKEITGRHEQKRKPPPTIEEMRKPFEQKPPDAHVITPEVCHRYRAPELFQHVLTAVLKANEKRLGFQSAATYLGYVQPEEFRQRLKQGMQFKDPTVPGGHGEFTHRIQWYLITKELEPPEEGWVDFYKWIGSVKHTKPVEGDEEDWGELGLWDLVVDRNKSGRESDDVPYNTDEDTDFRSPENLHQYIMEKLPATCPLLSSLISRRDFKRMKTGLLGPEEQLAEYAIENYAAKHMYRNPVFDNLEENQQAAVKTAIKEGLLLEQPPPAAAQ